MAEQPAAMRALAADNIEARVGDASWDAESAAWVSASAAWVARSASREATETKWPPGRHKSVAAASHLAAEPSTVATMHAEAVEPHQRGHTLAAAPASPVARFLGAASPGLISVLAASPIARAALWGGLQPTLAPAVEPVAAAPAAPAADASRPG